MQERFRISFNSNNEIYLFKLNKNCFQKALIYRNREFPKQNYK
jgi:hypothetical protein